MSSDILERYSVEHHERLGWKGIPLGKDYNVKPVWSMWVTKERADRAEEWFKEKYAKEWLDFVKDFVITDEVENYQVLYNEEADQIKRLADYMLTSVPDHEFQYDEFRTYVTEVDGRRNTSFAKTFPELAYLLNKNYYGKTQ
jgi:hypothetical protein